MPSLALAEPHDLTATTPFSQRACKTVFTSPYTFVVVRTWPDYRVRAGLSIAKIIILLINFISLDSGIHFIVALLPTIKEIIFRIKVHDTSQMAYARSSGRSRFSVQNRNTRVSCSSVSEEQG